MKLTKQVAVDLMAAMKNQDKGKLDALRSLDKLDGNYYLAHDIDWASEAYTYINATLTGTIDGNGYAIKNLRLKESTYNAASGTVTGNYFLDSVSSTGVIRDISFDGYGSHYTSGDDGGKMAQKGSIVRSNSGRLENVVVRAEGFIIHAFTGIAAINSFVYSSCGFAKISSASPCSTILPSFITSTR